MLPTSYPRVAPAPEEETDLSVSDRAVAPWFLSRPTRIRGLLVAFAFAASAAPAHAATTGAVFRPDGSAIAAATVRAFAPEASHVLADRVLAGSERPALGTAATDPQGRFSLDLPPGRVVELVVEVAGHLPAIFPVTSGESVGGLVVRMARSPAAGTPKPIRGTVVDATGGAVAGALLLWRERDSGLPAYVARTDERGSYEMPDPTGWAVGVDILHPHFAPLAQWFYENFGAAPLPTRFVLDRGRIFRGTVVDASGKPVAGATVRVGPWRRAQSAADGSFSLRAANEVARILVQHGSSAASGPLEDGVRLALTTLPAVRGRILDGSTRRGIAGAQVTASSRSSMSEVESTSVADANGNFELRDLAPADVILSVSAPGYEFAESYATVGLRGAVAATRDFTGARVGRIRGKVIDANNRPVPAAQVAFFDDSSPLLLHAALRNDANSAVTDADGTFALATAWLGTGEEVRLVAMRPGLPAAKSAAFKIRQGGSATGIVIKMGSGIEVSLAVHDTRGAPLSGVAVAVLAETDDAGFAIAAGMLFQEPTIAFPETGADGTLRLKLQPGAYDLSFGRRGYQPVTRQRVSVAPGMRPIAVVMDRGVAIAGTVQRADGVGIEGVGVVAVGAPDDIATRSDALGHFRLEGLAAGPYQVFLSKPEDAIEEVRDVQAPTESLRVVVSEGLEVAGRVVDEGTNQPVREFVVSSEREIDGVWESLERVTIDLRPGGTFTARGLEPGRVRFQVSALGYLRNTSDEIDVATTTAAPPVEVRLARGTFVSGRVSSSAGEALAAVTVRRESADDTDEGTDWVGSPPVLTGEDGTYRLEGLVPGELALNFSRDGWVPLTRTLQVSPAGARLDVRMTQGARLAGTVRSTDGKPIAEAYVACSGDSDQGTSTDDAGAFALTGLAEGTIALSVMKEGFRLREIENIDVAESARTSLEIVLEPVATGTVVGRVRGLGEDWSVRTVNVSGADGNASGSIDDAGDFRVEEAPAGAVTVEAQLWSARRSRTVATEAEVPAHGEVRVELRLDEGSAVEGRVTRAGEPVANANLRLDRASAGGLGTTSDIEGHYLFDGVEDGTWGVSVSTRDRSQYQTVLEVRGHTVFDIDIEGASVHGRVLDAATGDGVQGATVSLEATDARLRDLLFVPTSRSGVAGRFLMKSVPSGVWTVRAEHRDYGQARATVEVPESGEVQTTLSLEKSDGILVTLIDARSGRAVTGTVVARALDGTVVYDGEPRREGDGVRLPIAAGDYKISVSASGLATQTVLATVPAAGLRLTLTPGGTLVVHSQTGERRLAKLFGADGDEYLRCWCNRIADLWLTGARSKFDNIAAGDYTLAVFAADGERGDYAVTVVEGETVEVFAD
jgi:protocatechuate 3,4-dioxygenase beta subunit